MHTPIQVHSIMLLQLGRFMKILEEESSVMRLFSIEITYHSSVNFLKEKVTWYMKYFHKKEEERPFSIKRGGKRRTKVKGDFLIIEKA